jgi:hypothetical protein
LKGQLFTSTREQSRVPVHFLTGPLGCGLEMGMCWARILFFRHWQEIRVRAKQSSETTNKSEI